MTHRELYLHSMYAEIGCSSPRMTSPCTWCAVPLNGWGTPHFLTMIGGQHVMLRKFEPLALIQAIERHQVTACWPSSDLQRHAPSPRTTKHDLSSLKQVIIGGSPSSPTLIAGLEEALHCQAIVAMA